MTKTLVFSDTHLGQKFEEKKFRVLKHLITQADEVVINGDFWEGWQWSFDQFLSSPWKNLFPLLKQKNTVYLYGNHDKWVKGDERASVFAKEWGREYMMVAGKNIFRFVHGDQYSIIGSGKSYKVKLRHRLLSQFYDPVEALLTKGQINMLKWIYRPFNIEMKKNMKPVRLNGEFFVSGHTHSSELDMKGKYINSGFIRHGLAEYLWITDKEAKLESEWYE